MNLDRVIAVRNDKTVYRDGDRCVKVFHENYSKADILNEALNQARIEETGLPIPRVSGVTMIEGKWAIISEFIEGKTLSRLMAEEPERRDEYLKRFADLQTLVHGKTCPLLTQMKDKMRREIEQADLVATTRFALHVRLGEMPQHSRVCHGDFWPSNVIIRPDGSPCILDWSRATQGDPAVDAACTYLLFRINAEETTAAAYLAHFSAASGIPEAEIRRWIPVAAASQSVSGGGKKRDFLLSRATEKEQAE